MRIRLAVTVWKSTVATPIAVATTVIVATVVRRLSSTKLDPVGSL